MNCHWREKQVTRPNSNRNIDVMENQLSWWIGIIHIDKSMYLLYIYKYRYIDYIASCRPLSLSTSFDCDVKDSLGSLFRLLIGQSRDTQFVRVYGIFILQRKFSYRVCKNRVESRNGWIGMCLCF